MSVTDEVEIPNVYKYLCGLLQTEKTMGNMAERCNYLVRWRESIRALQRNLDGSGYFPQIVSARIPNLDSKGGGTSIRRPFNATYEKL